MLSRITHELLTKIISHKSRQSNKLFNKRDNTFLHSNRYIAKQLDIPASSVDRLFRICRDKGLISDVIDNTGVLRPMLNPAFLWYRKREERPLASFIFKLGSYEKAINWRKVCSELGRMVDPITGEDKGYYDWVKVDEYAQSYEPWDLHYRKDIRLTIATFGNV